MTERPLQRKPFISLYNLEIRSASGGSKSETNSNYRKGKMIQTEIRFEFSDLNIRYCFEFRISNFEFLLTVLPGRRPRPGRRQSRC